MSVQWWCRLSHDALRVQLVELSAGEGERGRQARPWNPAYRFHGSARLEAGCSQMNDACIACWEWDTLNHISQ